MDLAYLAELPREEFVERRNRVFEQMQDNSALVVFTETEKRRKAIAIICSDLIVISGI